MSISYSLDYEILLQIITSCTNQIKDIFLMAFTIVENNRDS